MARNASSTTPVVYGDFASKYEQTYTINGRDGWHLLGYVDGGGHPFEDPDGNCLVIKRE